MSSTSLPHPLESNFLVPNGTFFVELIAFVIMFAILAKWIIPPINKAMTARQEAIRQQFAEAEEAKEAANQAEADYKAQLSDARHEAAKIREQAREDGAQIKSELRDQAQAEAARIVQTGHAQVSAERQQAAASLRTEVGTLATSLAGRIVGESLDDDARSGRVVDRFLADLEAADDAKAAANGSSAAPKAAAKKASATKAPDASAPAASAAPSGGAAGLVGSTQPAQPASYAGSAKAHSDGSQPEGFAIKGNEDSMLYHAPGTRWYDITIAEVWFDSVESAEAAGFTKAGARKKKDS